MEGVFSCVSRELTEGVFCYIGGPAEWVFSFVPQLCLPGAHRRGVLLRRRARGMGFIPQLCPPGAHRRGVLLRRGARGMGV